MTPAFLPTELIRKKRFGGQHSRDEIRFLVQGFAHGRLPDYQMSAWLMAICLKGMSAEETAWLTQEMRDSGVCLDLKDLGFTVDKHSTGGVGDKVSLILAPLVAALGVPVPMMAGRGLGHTGGTLDKLESIPGFSVDLSFTDFKRQVGELGVAIIGQTSEICPADRKLYSLRDVTGTVDSLPLICGSIMSKKLAEGMAGLVLDVKFGSGAFMKSLGDAETLARALMDIGTQSGKQVRALITRMDEPLGRFIGNALEVRECLDILEGRDRPSGHTFGKTYADTIELTLHLAAHMLHLGGQARTPEQGLASARAALMDGRAKTKFIDLCLRQGGDLNAPLAAALHRETVHAEKSGYMHYRDIEKLGLAGVRLGAGREFQTDKIDFAAGIEVFWAQGDPVPAGAPLFQLMTSDRDKLPAALSLIRDCHAVSAQPHPPSPLIAKVLL